MTGLKRDLNEDHHIMSLKRKAKHLRGKELGNGGNTCPEHTIRSVVILKEKVKHFKEEGFDKENNNREEKHQLYDRRSRIYHKNNDQKYTNGYQRHRNDEVEAGERPTTESLKQKAKQFKDIESHINEVRHQNGHKRNETNDEKDPGDEIIARLKQKAKCLRGRGFSNGIKNREGVHSMSTASSCHGTDNEDVASEPQRSAEGWTLFVTNISDEADEDDIQDKFSDYGPIMNLSINVDRRTGFCKGYALVLFETYEDASSAKDALDGAEIMGQPIKVDWCFVRGSQRVQKVAEDRRH